MRRSDNIWAKSFGKLTCQRRRRQPTHGGHSILAGLFSHKECVCADFCGNTVAFLAKDALLDAEMA